MFTSHWRPVVAVFAAVGLMAGLSAGCSAVDVGQSDEGVESIARAAVQPRPGGRLVYGINADPNGLDPTRNAWDATGIELANALYDRLMAFDTDGIPQPYLAE